jgi:NitT/TauT family transport system substrate-binding protein
MKFLKSAAWALLLLAFSSSFLSGSRASAAGREDPVLLRVGYGNMPVGYPYFVAVDRGFFASEGLKVEPVFLMPVNRMADALIAGRIDASAPMSLVTLLAVEEKSPGLFRMLCSASGDLKNFGDRLLVRTGSPIRDVRQLRGRKIGVIQGTTAIICLKIVLRNWLDPDKDVTLVPMEPRLHMNALLSGQVDALMASEPLTSILLEKKEARSILDAPLEKYVINPFPGAVSVVSTRCLSRNPEAARRFSRAMDRAVDYMRTNPRECLKIFSRYTGLPESASNPRQASYWKLAEIDAGVLQRFADILLREGILKKNIPIRPLLYSPERK